MKKSLPLVFGLLLIPLISFWGFSHSSKRVPQATTVVPLIDYERLWQEVDKLDNEGLPKSALALVQTIYDEAKKSSNHTQLMKALFYKTKYTTQLEEDGNKKAIALFTAEISEASFPLKSLLQSTKAEMLWNYYNSKRYTILQRTPGAETGPDIDTWTAELFINEITRLHLEALKPDDKLQQLSLTSYDYILDTAYGSKVYRPTLYDLMAHRAIDFFSNDESGITQAKEGFETDHLSGYSPDVSFVAHQFATPDTTDHLYLAVTLYQKLTHFHMLNSDLRPLLALELERLNFFGHRNKSNVMQTAYEVALRKLIRQAKDYSFSTVVYYHLASVVKDYRQEYPEALDICDQGIEAYPDSKGAKLCRWLKHQITQKALEVLVEQQVAPDQPFLAKTTYRNLDQVWYRVVKLSWEDYTGYAKRRISFDQMAQELIAKTPTLAFDYTLPLKKDYRTHSAEVKVPALPMGHYVLLACADQDFAQSKAKVTVNTFWVSNLHLINIQENSANRKLAVVHAKEGSPLKDVTVKLLPYNYNNRRQEPPPTPLELTSDKNGVVTVPKQIGYEVSGYDLRTKEDRLVEDRWYYNNYYYQRENKVQTRTHFFTDRKIYRPGQTIYFKGLVVSSSADKKEQNVVPNHKTTVTLHDVNYQEIGKVEAESNTYGTFSGTFVLPTGMLTGQVTIRSPHGNLYLRVEEYKRPKFEVTFNPVKGTYKVNETVQVEGQALAFAGNALSDASLKYRVTRMTTYGYYCWWKPMPPANPIEITHGTTRLDAQGRFTISFKALPDPEANPDDQPEFTYRITADVTDLNGETQSNNTSVHVGYTSFKAGLSLPEYLPADRPHPIKLSIVNSSGSPVTAAGSIRVEQLTTPEQVFRERLWSTPDTNAIKRKEFRNLFPHDIFRNENQLDQWPVAQVAARASFDSIPNRWPLALKGYPPGVYRITLQASKGNEQITRVAYTYMFDRTGKKPTANEALSLIPVNPNKQQYAPGETARYLLTSAYKNLWVTYWVEEKGTITSQKRLKLSQSATMIEVPITEEHRGNISLHAFAVKHHRQHTFTQTIAVPWSNKALQVKLSSFRDKTRPGAAETWTLSLKGPQAEPITTEILTSMYDASLDAFAPNSWNLNLWPTRSSQTTFAGRFTIDYGRSYRSNWQDYRYPTNAIQDYDRLNWFGLQNYIYTYRWDYGDVKDSYFAAPVLAEKTNTLPGVAKLELQKEREGAKYDDLDANYKAFMPDRRLRNKRKEEDKAEASPPQVRSNFNETAFFYPQLKTQADGTVDISFTMPESLTRWKFMALAHTPDLKTGYLEQEVVTQKELMVQPNMPRFLRTGDQIKLSAKIVNLTDSAFSGTAEMVLYDAFGNIAEEDLFKQDTKTNQVRLGTFQVKAKQSTVVTWPFTIPDGLQAMTYKIIAKTDAFSDGEQATLPVLSDKILITESLPLPMRGKGSKTFSFNKLKASGSSTTLSQHQLTLEFTANPTWYAIQSLPYMMDYPHECAEQTFNRMYANLIASHLANQHPKIKAVFESWKTQGQLKSALQKNQELKALLLEETPWLLEGQNEAERMARLGELFDDNQMRYATQKALKRLQELQLPNGAWPWFSGMRENRFITQYIVTGMAKLEKRNMGGADWKRMKKQALYYLDVQMFEEYWRLKNRQVDLKGNHISGLIIQYLYARNLSKQPALDEDHQQAYHYWMSQAKNHWKDRNKMEQGMIALALHHGGDKVNPKAIIRSLKEFALSNEEMGMYWKSNRGGYYWNQAPIETQAVLIEAFETIAQDPTSVASMRVWLLKQKQVQNWKTTKATADACYALLGDQAKNLTQTQKVTIALGGTEVIPEQPAEAGTGYLRQTWRGPEVKPAMGQVTVNKSGDGLAWGALHWQYFERLDKITPHDSPLKLKKQVYVVRQTDNGLRIELIKPGVALKVGDRVRIRLELRSDRDMEYLHLKDLRASGLEPINVFSGYRYQGGLGYYESTKDAATHFFMARMNKGTYVFEYDLRVAHAGTFQNGIASIQCMYAPEFSSHSAGVSLQVE